MTDEHEQGRKHSQPWCLTHDAPMVCSAGDVPTGMTEACLPTGECRCSCHTIPGVKHVVACCDQPPALDIDLARIMEDAMPKGPIPGGFISEPVPHHTHPSANPNYGGPADCACGGGMTRIDGYEHTPSRCGPADTHPHVECDELLGSLLELLREATTPGGAVLKALNDPEGYCRVCSDWKDHKPSCWVRRVREEVRRMMPEEAQAVLRGTRGSAPTRSEGGD